MMNHQPCAHRGVQLACVLYLLIPLMIFAFGWLKWYYALAVLIVVAFCFVRMLRDLPRLALPPLNRRDWGKLIAGVCVICFITVFSGVGGKVFQTADHVYRNELFKILVDYPWPVVRGDRAMVYYIGFWLPAALVGKALGLNAGFNFQMVWFALGMTLLFLLLCIWRKKIALWPLLAFLFFSGLDIFASLYTMVVFPDLEMTSNMFSYGISLDHWSFQMMYPSLMTNLFWSFQQAVPVYLLIMLLLLQKNCRNYAFFAAPCLLCATLPVVGLVPIALTLACSRPVDDDPVDRRWLSGKEAWTGALKDACSPQNLLGGGVIALLLWLYLSTNDSGALIGMQLGFSSSGRIGVSIILIMYYLVAVATEFGVYLLLIVPAQRKNALLPVLAILLLICPIIRVGQHADFCMRISMAALPFLSLIVMDTLIKYKAAGKKLLLSLLIVALALGALTPLSEIARTGYRTFVKKQYGMGYVSEDAVFSQGNFSGSMEGSVFFDWVWRG